MAHCLAPERIEKYVVVASLPVQLTAFVGRESECAEITRLLGTTRLLTLVGSGGVGKTRLSLEVARTVAETYAHGAALIELASVGDPDLVASRVAAGLGLRDVPADGLDQALVTFLGSKQLLLIVDNCEHLLAVAAELVDRLLHECHDLTILATSRQPLAIAGETAWPVPSLAVPDPGANNATDEIAACDAARLFHIRALAVAPGFAITDSNAAAVAQICHRLGGIPLALELAAARTRMLSPEQILQRLDDRFGLLIGGSRTAPSRQQTLRATLDWSFALLGPQEAALLRRVSVFAGGCALEDMEAIVIADDFQSEDVLDALGGLVDKSLVLADTGGAQTRYRVLETVREYAREKLNQADEATMLLERHATWYSALAERAEQELMRADQAVWLDRLDRDHDNLRAALGWARRANPALGLALVASLGRFWETRGYLAEGRTWLDAFLAMVPGRNMVRARALQALGELVRRTDVAHASAAFEESIAIHRELGDSVSGALALRQLGLTKGYSGDRASGRHLMDQSVEVCRRLQDPAALGWALGTRGMLARMEADYDRAQVLFDEALPLLRPSGDIDGLAFILNNMGQLARTRGDNPSARRLLDESLGLFRMVSSKPRMAWTLNCLGNLAREQGDLVRAEELLREAVTLERSIAMPLMLAQSLVFVGILVIRLGDPARGVELIAAGAQLPSTRAMLDEDELSDWDAGLATARSQLGVNEFERAWTRGSAMGFDQAAGRVLVRPTPERLHAEPASTGLTERECEVVVLIAQGRSNREIADALVIAERTAEAHVSHVLTKLGLRSRAQVAVWAVERGMLAGRGSLNSAAPGAPGPPP
jgi:non-specific serine/threonine protein kinase